MSAAAPVDFNREIRPILSANCFACHGPDAAERQADLRLDTRSGALADLGGHAAHRPRASPRQASWCAASRPPNPTQLMPPADSGKKLSPEQIELVRRWVAEGAQWQEHWAYAPAARPALPATRQLSEPRLTRSIAFVQARLADGG